MSWVQENKFLTGYIAVMVLGVGALGYKVFAASSALDEANAQYSAKAASYDSLRRVVPYPSRENLTKVEAQKKEAAEVINAFQADLAKREFPIQPMSPVEFQDQLKKGVTEARAKAQGSRTSLEKFYLGFDRYETAPPDKDVVNALGRELKAIEWVVDQFLSAPVLDLKINRPEMPEEKGKAAAAAKPAAPQKGPAAKNQPELVTSRSFEVTVKCKPRQLSHVLNTIVSANAPQFYIVRSVKIVNENLKGPPKKDPNAEEAAAPAPSPDPNTAVVDIHYIVGEENIIATLRIEIVDFAEPPNTASK